MQWYRSVSGYVYFGNLMQAGDAAAPTRPSDNHFWNDAKFLNKQDPWDYKPVTALPQIKKLIQQGQETLAANPLPNDIVRQIYQLEVYLDNYNSREAYSLMKDEIEAFNIPEDREDITEEQRQVVNGLKAMMLAFF